MRTALVFPVFCASTAIASIASAGPFSYDPPGVLVAGSGTGRVDTKVYAPGILFPIKLAPAFANSQVWGVGGSSGPSGSQCDPRNFTYPWHDNYCETRSWTMPLCPAGTGHQGQDVRASDCTPSVHDAVAVVDGTITNVGSYSVYLTAADGTRYDYLHMRMLAVAVGDKLKRGDLVGKVSDNFGTSSTTVHLHFNIQQNVTGVGVVYVPPYLSLIAAYETLIGVAPGDAGGDATIADGGKDSGGSSDSARDSSSSASDSAPASDDGGSPDGADDASTAGDGGGSSGCGCAIVGTSEDDAMLFGASALVTALVAQRRRRR